MGRGTIWLALAVTLAALQGPAAVAEEAAAANPLGRDPAAIESGDELFHERCAVCHGQRGQGAMAANLVRTRKVRRGSEASLFALIREGIPGTEMPPHPDLPKEGIWQIVSYLRSLALPGQQPPLPGDPVAGQAVFRRAGCAGCHVVNGAGGFLGPSLDSIAERKTSGEIRSDVLDPDAELAAGYEPVSLVTNDGRRVRGVLKNEDTFLLIVLLASGETQVFQRADLRSVELPRRSHMPADYRDRLSRDELRDVLAFLDRQRDPFVPVIRGFAVY